MSMESYLSLPYGNKKSICFLQTKRINLALFYQPKRRSEEHKFDNCSIVIKKELRETAKDKDIFIVKKNNKELSRG